MFDMSFSNISYMRMKYKFGEEWMIFDILAEDEWEQYPLILYEICREDAISFVDRGVGIWVLDGIPCVDEDQAVRGARAQAKYIKIAFEYVGRAYQTLRERGEIHGIQGKVGHVHSHTKNWGKVAEVGTSKHNGKGD